MAEHPTAGVDYPAKWQDLLAWFPDDAHCLAYFERLRWAMDSPVLDAVVRSPASEVTARVAALTAVTRRQ